MLASSSEAKTSSQNSSSNGEKTASSPQPPPQNVTKQVSSKSFLFVLTCGFLIRVYLANKPTLISWLQNRVEIVTPLNSWQRVLEGIYLKNRLVDSASAYQGDLVHELPIMLRLYELILDIFDSTSIKYLFVLADCLNAVLIYSIARSLISYLINLEKTDLKSGVYTRFLLSAAKSEPESKSAETFLLTPQSFPSHYWSLIVLIVYLFNPFTCASCLALSTATFQNTILLLWLYCLVTSRPYACMLFLAWHSNCSVYSINLVPVTLNYIHQHTTYVYPKREQTYIHTILRYSSVYVLFNLGLLALNFYIEHFDWRFVDCTYMFILRVPDLLPNMGLFWYFFTEMFDHFVVFFTYVFQLNAFVYSLPLAARLSASPPVNLLIQLALLALFRSYPSVAETGLYLSLAPCFVSYLFPLMRNLLIYSCMFLVAVVLAPVMFYLWLGSGGGNANFYFAITLVYSVAQILFVVDVLYAHLKREFIKLNGIDNPKNADGSLAKFSLD